MKYIIKLFRVNTMVVTKEFLKSENVTDIGSIPISSKDYINESNNLKNNRLRTSYLQELYHPYNMNYNPGMASYLTSTQNPCLDYQNLDSSHQYFYT